MITRRSSMVKKQDTEALNPYAKRRLTSAHSGCDSDTSQSQSLLQPTGQTKSAPIVKSRQRITRKGSVGGVLCISLTFLVGLAVGFLLYSHIETGMTDIQDAILAAQRAKQNAAVLHQGVEGDGTVITRVAGDAFQLHIMTFNLRYGTAADGANSWRFRRAHAADIINRYVPVVFGTQEGLEEQLTELQSLLARPYHRFGEPRETNGEHVQIFYDSTVVERLDGGTFWLSETPGVPGSKGWDGGCVRIATWCRFRFLATKQEFYHVNTHLDSQGPIARYEGAKVVWHEMDKIMARDALPEKTPFLLTGDFNTFRPSNVFQYLTHDPAGPRLQDSWSASSHQIGNISCTFHEFLGPKYDTLPHSDWHDPSMDPLNRVGTNHIDFILSRPPLPTLATEVITEAWNGRYPSDHYPVIATLLFPSAEELPPPPSTRT